MWFLLVSLVLLVGCGRSTVRIASPADGQRLTIGAGQYSCVDVILEENDYVDSTIEFRGAEQVVGELSCVNGAGGPARCCSQPTGQFGSTTSVGAGQNCTEQRPCTITIIATRGDQKDVRTMTVVRQGFGTTPR